MKPGSRYLISRKDVGVKVPTSFDIKEQTETPRSSVGHASDIKRVWNGSWALETGDEINCEF